MPALANAQHEAFCQNIVKDPTRNASKAAQAAGFTGSGFRVQASRLLKRPDVALRISELEALAETLAGDPVTPVNTVLTDVSKTDANISPNVLTPVSNVNTGALTGPVKNLPDLSPSENDPAAIAVAKIKARLLRELKLLGHSDVTAAFSQAEGDTLTLADLKALPSHVRRAIKKVKVRKVTRSTEDGDVTETFVEVELWDKNAALRMLGESQGVFKSVLEHHNGTLEDELKRLNEEAKRGAP